LTITALAVVLPATAGAATSSSESPMNVFDTIQKIPGAFSVLYRNDTGAAMRIDTRDLPSGTYTVWWIIWNDPGVCSAVPCGLGDLFKPGNDLGFATGGIVASANGKFTPAAGLTVGDLKNMLLGVGLTDPHGAEIHLVVQWHGPIDPEVVHLQMQSPPGGTCNPPVTGCQDLQSSIHLP
jgi:hypothetical protein